MRAQLIQYVDLLFAGTKDCEDIHQEILQNTLDRYDDLIIEGKTPEAAYRLAILGIGDINEILGAPSPVSSSRASTADKKVVEFLDEDSQKKKLMRAIAIGLYILCPVPLIICGALFNNGVLGVTSLLAMVAVATVLLIMGSPKEEEQPEEKESPLEKSIGNLIWAIGLAAYFAISFLTGAWHITWVIFPLIGAVKGLIKAILDLKEAAEHEN